MGSPELPLVLDADPPRPGEDRPHLREPAAPAEPPWKPTADNLAAIDRHFWDWLLWLAGKEAAGERDLVVSELEKLFQHLLAPLGVGLKPGSLTNAVAAYRDARGGAERELGLRVPRDLETEIVPVLDLG